MQWCWAGGAGLAVVVAVLVRMAYASKYNGDIDRMCGGLILTVLILAAAVAAGLPSAAGAGVGEAGRAERRPR